jgi:DNA-binding NarL/FixJ family response regulator
LHLRALDPEIEVFHAKTIAEGRAQIETHRPDLVFLDLRFEDEPMAGLELLKWIKSSPDYDHIPVIVMSGELLDRKAVEDLLGENAAGFLSKGKADSAGIFKIAMMNMEEGAVFIHGARAGAIRTPEPSQAERQVAPRTAASLGLRESHQKVLMLHVRGMPYKRIARECNLAEVTVKEYVSDMCKMFKVENAKALIYEIARAGVVLREED